MYVQVYEGNGREKACRTHLQPLLDAFHKVVAICRESVDGEDGVVGPKTETIIKTHVSDFSFSRRGDLESKARRFDSQPKHLLRISRLNAITFRLTCISSDHAEISSCDRENRTAVRGVGVELAAITQSERKSE